MLVHNLSHSKKGLGITLRYRNLTCITNALWTLIQKASFSSCLISLGATSSNFETRYLHWQVQDYSELHYSASLLNDQKFTPNRNLIYPCNEQLFIEGRSYQHENTINSHVNVLIIIIMQKSGLRFCWLVCKRYNIKYKLS